MNFRSRFDFRFLRPHGQADGCWCPGASLALPSRVEGARARGAGDPGANPQGHRASLTTDLSGRSKAPRSSSQDLCFAGNRMATCGVLAQICCDMAARMSEGVLMPLSEQLFRANSHNPAVR